jgi:uncharacterized protein YecT (DUF1311 family)
MNRSALSAILITGMALLSLVYPSQPGRAADPDPIDIALYTCLSSADGQTTIGMVECMTTAIGAWDRRLNEVYQKAMSALDPQSRELLRKSQRQWLAFRQRENAAMGGPWRQNAGTLARVTTVDAELGALKERVRELHVYVE